jgi:hypothetical protein
MFRELLQSQEMRDSLAICRHAVFIAEAHHSRIKLRSIQNAYSLPEGRLHAAK